MLKIFVVTALTSTLLSGCSLFYRYEDISEVPPKGGVTKPLEARSSTLQPNISIPIGELERAANAAATKLLPVSDQGRENIGGIEVDLPWPLPDYSIYLDVDWHYTASQPSPISLTGVSNQLQVSIPAAVSGQAGFNGAIAKILELDAKNFGGALNVLFRSGFSANANYCPVLTGAYLEYDWTTDPYLELMGQSCIFGACVGPWRLNLRSEVDSALKPQLSAVSSVLQQNIPCQPIRTALRQAWRNYSFPIAVPYGRLHLNISPTALYLPGLDVSPTDLTFLGRLDAKVSVDVSPLADFPLPFPQNIPSPISPGRFFLAVPLSTQYYTLEALAKQTIEGRKITGDTPLGPATIFLRSVQVYPSGDSLAVGISAAIEFKYLFFFNTSGTIWLTAKPSVDSTGKVLRFTDVKVTRKFSNVIWDVASVLADDAIASALMEDFSLDLASPLSQAEADLTRAINGAGQPGIIELTATNVSIRAGRVQTSDIALQLEALLEANVKAQFEAIDLDK